LGFTEESQEYLINHAQIVLHAAADVRFDQTIKKAVEINVRGTRDLLKLVSQFKKLEVITNFKFLFSKMKLNCKMLKFQGICLRFDRILELY
jgi:alcohol-forming fatty acyl-CoA reductase